MLRAVPVTGLCLISPSFRIPGQKRQNRCWAETDDGGRGAAEEGNGVEDSSVGEKLD